ncbi:hypothetical protein PG994_008807 [Apiospora phragmitis]|uniref:Uncharacterized protein n=1 Tax=Apiospora phragmitis TaxID=2905665 RepID=A0ABR1UHH8_9PEZI
MRLELPDGFGGFHIWDMPDPPPVADCRFAGAVVPQATQFLTVDLRRATGLTFHFDHGKVYEISAHTREAPYARRAVQQQQQNGGRRMVDRTVWVHLPIPKGEEILAVAVRMTRANHHELSTQRPCFLFRMKLAGDVSLARLLGGLRRRQHQPTKPRIVDIQHSQHRPGHPVRDVSWHTSRRGNNPRNDDENHNDDGSSGPPFSLQPSTPPGGAWAAPNGHNPLLQIDQTKFSSAPLDNVTRLQVLGSGLRRHHHHHHSAVLLDYANGARRALGNCRPGVDPVAGAYAHPARICYRAFVHRPAATVAQAPTGGLYQRPSALRRMVQVEGGPEPAASPHGHHNRNEEWVCSDVQGKTMKLWFSAENSIISIVPATMPRPIRLA